MNPNNPSWHLVDPELLPLLEAEVRRHVKWADVQNRWGLVLLLKGEFEAALAQFDRALGTNPLYGWAALNRVCTLGLLGREEDARAALADAPEAANGAHATVAQFLDLVGTETPADSPPEAKPGETGEGLHDMRLRAALCRRAGQDAEAERIWEDARNHVPAGIDGDLAAPWDERGETGGRTVSFVPGIHQLWLALSTTKARLRRRGPAEHDAALAFLAWSDEGTYLHQRGEIESILGTEEEARAYYEGSVRAAPEAPQSHAALAFLWSAAGEVERARRALGNALRLAPLYADLHYQLALVEHARGDGEAALRSLQEALRINPHYTVARLEEASLYCLLGRWEEARASTVSVRTAGVASADLAVQLGRIELALGHENAAEMAWREALELDPEDPVALGELGRLFRRQGRREEAKEIWKRLLETGVEREEPQDFDRAVGDED